MHAPNVDWPASHYVRKGHRTAELNTHIFNRFNARFQGLHGFLPLKDLEPVVVVVISGANIIPTNALEVKSTDEDFHVSSSFIVSNLFLRGLKS